MLVKDSGDQVSILSRVIPKTQKMILDDALLNTQHCKLRIKDKMEQSRKKNSPHHLGVVAYEKRPSDRPRQWSLAFAENSHCAIVT